MALLPYVPIGLSIIERIYSLVAKVQAHKTPSKNKELETLQEDVGLLKEAVELQTKMFSQRESNLTECVEALERQVRGLKFQVWGLGIALIGVVIYFGVIT